MCDTNVTMRLGGCVEELIRWGKKLRLKFREDIDKCKKRMEQIQRSPSLEDQNEMKLLNDKLTSLLVQEDSFWRRRAKQFWMRDGDQNTRFFHTSATQRKKKNYISKLLDDNNVEVTDPGDICNVASNYFANLFTKVDGVYEPVLATVQQRVTEADNMQLTRPFDEAEFQMAISQMHPDKAPGPDGLNPAFYQRFWDLCGKDIYLAGCRWLTEGRFPTNLNDTNIVLIPKCDDPKTMKDLRPISLCNVLYKIVSKVLANRLRKVINKCISEEQSAFVEGRSILDNALIAIELIHYMKCKTKGKMGDVALKIDISKAYDKIDWGFLRGMMAKLGFNNTWIDWIMMCVESVVYQVQINNDQVGPIFPTRGLR